MLSAENGVTVGRVEFAPDYGRWNREAFGGRVPGPMEVDPRKIAVHLSGQSPTDRAAEIGVPYKENEQSGDNTFTRSRRVDPYEMWHLPPLTVPANDNRKLPKVVALHGVAGSGKSTLADYLVERYGYVRVKFAAPLKDMMRAIGLGEAHIEGELKEVPTPILQGKTPRYAMQTIGTDWGRDLISPDLWTGLWARSANDVLDHGGRVVCDDCRFDNEADVVRGLGGVVFGIVGRGGLAGSHASEAGIDVDVVLHNVGSIRDLQERADEVLFGLI